MHSAFIGELLDPSGSHVQGDIFLKLFINQFNLNKNDYDIQYNAPQSLDQKFDFLFNIFLISLHLILVIPCIFCLVSVG